MLKNATATVTLLTRLAVLLCIVFVMFAVFRFFRPRPRFEINTSHTAVVKQIQELQRLETASFTIEKIIEAQKEGNALQKILFGDRILLIAHGQVIAGFDFSQIQESDIAVQDKKITLKLPPPQILLTRLDNEKTTVYDRQKGFLTKGETDLEAEARQAAEKSIQQGACESKILETASENGRKQVTALLNALGFTQVEISIPEGACQ